MLNDVTPLMPLAHELNSTFKFKHHTFYDPKGPEKNVNSHITAVLYVQISVWWALVTPLQNESVPRGILTCVNTWITEK